MISSGVEGVDTKKLIEAEDNDVLKTVMETTMKPTSVSEMCKFLEDAIFETDPHAEDNQAEAPSTGTQITVPGKFRVDDGTREVIEKTESEGLEKLFDLFSQDTPQTSQTLNVCTT